MKRRGFLKFLGLAPVVAAAVLNTPATLMDFFEPLPAPPEIGGWVSYKYRFVVTLPPEHSVRLRYLDCTPIS